MSNYEPNLSALIASGIPEEMAAMRVKLAIATWGSGFAKLAENPRLLFTGDTVEIKLWKKITTSDGETSTLTMREPEMEALQKLDALPGPMAQTKRVIVTSCAITDRECGQIGLRDLTLIGQIVQAFTSAVPEIGETL